MAVRKPDIDAPGSRAQDDPKSPTREVRAGPGDAGRQDRPEPLPRPEGDARRGRRATTLLVGLVVLGLVVWALMVFAA